MEAAAFCRLEDKSGGTSSKSRSERELKGESWSSSESWISRSLEWALFPGEEVASRSSNKVRFRGGAIKALPFVTEFGLVLGDDEGDEERSRLRGTRGGMFEDGDLLLVHC